VPDLDLLPLDAAAIQSDGQLTVAKIVPVSADAQLAGGEPVKIRMTADVPIVVSI
jgi:hypothetical protein